MKSRIFAAPALALLLSIPAFGVGTTIPLNDGFAKIGRLITDIDANGATLPWRSESGVYAISVDGTFDGASVEIQWRICGDEEQPDCSVIAFGQMPTTPTITSKDVVGNIQLYFKTEVRLLISGVGASTDLDVIMRGTKSKE